MFTSLYSNIHLYVKFYVSCVHWRTMLAFKILHGIISFVYCVPLRGTTPAKGVFSSLVGQINHIIPHSNSKCHVHCTQGNLQQPLLRTSMLELLVDGTLQGKITFPLHHYPFQLVDISTLIHRPIPCYLFTILFISLKLLSSLRY
jgi:hypothetical protein